MNIFFIYEEVNTDTIGWAILSIINAAYLICIISSLFNLFKLIVRKAIIWYKKRKLNINEDTEEPNDVKRLDKNREDLDVSSESKTEFTVRQLEDIHVDIDNEGQKGLIMIEDSKIRPEQHDTGSNLFTRNIENTHGIMAVSNRQDSSNYDIDRHEWQFDIKSGRFKLKKKEYFDIEKLIGIPEDISAIYDLGITYLVESQIYIENIKSPNPEVDEDKILSPDLRDSSLKLVEYDAMVYTDSKISATHDQQIASEDPIPEM